MPLPLNALFFFKHETRCCRVARTYRCLGTEEVGVFIDGPRAIHSHSNPTDERVGHREKWGFCKWRGSGAALIAQASSRPAPAVRTGDATCPTRSRLASPNWRLTPRTSACVPPFIWRAPTEAWNIPQAPRMIRAARSSLRPSPLDGVVRERSSRTSVCMVRRLRLSSGASRFSGSRGIAMPTCRPLRTNLLLPLGTDHCPHTRLRICCFPSSWLLFPLS